VTVLRWLLEQGTWAGPIAVGVMYSRIPRWRRTRGLTVVVAAWGLVFVGYFLGCWPSSVSCDWSRGMPPTCTEQTASVERAGDTRRHGAHETLRADDRAMASPGSVGVEVESSAPVVVDGGASLDRAGAVSHTAPASTQAQITGS
jgi:hypothetical protein